MQNNIVRYNNPHELVLAQKNDFNAVNSDDAILFEKEAQFAIQHLDNNQYLAKVAMQNQPAMVAAVRNVAAIGISLNPAQKHAYLVPRGGKVVLDLSYLGLLHIATESGSILWAQCKIVYSSDSYESNGVDKSPTHTYNPFNKNRGEIIGAYCVAKTRDGAFLTEEMSMDEIAKVRSRSESFKKGGMSPWKTDEGEMIRKTVIKRGYKYWPKTNRMSEAVEMLNNQEGIDFKSERAAAVHDINPTPDQLSEIRKALDFIGRKEGDCLAHFCANVFKRGIPSLEEMTSKEAGQMLDMLKQMADAMAAKQSGDEF